jgi:hypothetical protein
MPDTALFTEMTWSSSKRGGCLQLARAGPDTHEEQEAAGADCRAAGDAR